MLSPPQPHPAGPAVVTFTPKGERALDALAATLTHQMARTPAGIVDVLDKVLHAPLADLLVAFDLIAAAIPDTPQPSEVGPRHAAGRRP